MSFTHKKVGRTTQAPLRGALRIGHISVDGNGYSDFQDLIKKAKKQAASLGGDFILPEDSGVVRRDIYSPGYSTYNSNSNANYNSNYGYAHSQAHGYSVGPSVTSFSLPWSVYSVWVYAPIKLGVKLEGNKINGFHLKSDAKRSGIKIDDELIGIDDFDIQDQRFVNYFMSKRPGDKLKITVLRGSKTKEFYITALPND